MAKGGLYCEIERYPGYSPSEASFIIEQVAHMDGLKNRSLRERLDRVAVRIDQQSYDKPDIRFLDLFRKSSSVLKKDNFLLRGMKDVIWQMRHNMWFDDYSDGGSESITHD